MVEGAYQPATHLQPVHDEKPVPVQLMASHGEHRVSPVEFAYQPATQDVQTDACELVLYVPNAQDVHVVEPTTPL